MMAYLFGKSKKKKEEDPLKDDHETKESMEWFDDIVDGSKSDKKNKAILSKFWQEFTGANMINRITSPQQRYAAKIWGKLCHRCDASYPACDKLKATTLTDTDAFDEAELKYAVRHAIASYPPAFVCFLGLKTDTSFAFKSNKKLLNSAFGIAKEDVVIDNCSMMMGINGKTHQPHFYLALDRAMKRIIISIRGSSSIADALTDVNAMCKEYSAHKIDGYVHEGMIASARFVFDKATKTLVSLCNEYKDYQVLLTGHSLGAGVAALLGLMYVDHPVICKQNKCKVWAFASPPVVSQSFIDAKIGLDMIRSVAINTDLVCRLSIESIKQQNERLDAINKYPTDAIKECMMNLKDFDDEQRKKQITGATTTNDEDTKGDEPQYESLLTPFNLIKTLKEVKTPNPKDQLFPLGKILWYVPKAALEKDGVARRRTLMGMEDENKKEKKKVKFGSKNDSVKDVMKTTWHNITVGFEEFQETMDNPLLSGGYKHALKFDGSHYALVDATDCRDVFQEFVLDLPEALAAHMPNRYMWACNAHLTRGNLHYDNEK